MQRTGTTVGIAALLLLTGSAEQAAHATEARHEHARATQRTAADGKLALRDGGVLTRVYDARTGEPIAGALVRETPWSFGVRAQGYREAEVALAPSRSQERRELPGVAMCALGASDHDHDGLCDDAERRYKTDPTLADSDGDAIPDAVEINGDKLPDGTLFDLRALGADPKKKDVFVRYDWTPNREPGAESVRLVTEAYAAAPATAPDFTPGINLHLQRGQQLASQGDVGLTPKAIKDIRDQSFKQTFSFPFHYVLFTDFLVGHDASGISPEIPGVNFVVSLGVVKNVTPLIEAGTLMHELGHNLGLQHGGNEPMNNKPNYLSVMNYLYQFDGFQRVPGDRRTQTARVIDYARFETEEVDERNLDERVGFKAKGASQGASFTIYNPFYMRCPIGVIGKRLLGCSYPKLNGQFPGAIDFNGVRGPVDTGVRVDLNGNHRRDVFREGINDWASLNFTGIADPTIIRVAVSGEEVDEDPTCPPPLDAASSQSDEDAVPPPLDEPGDTLPGGETPTDPGPTTEPEEPPPSDPGPGTPGSGDEEPQEPEDNP